MKILVFGSLNIDKVYTMPSLPMQGETLTCKRYEVHVGGKGLNQAVSLCKAGADVSMAGCVGTDGDLLVEFLRSTGVHTDKIRSTEGFTGHAVILVDGNGQNQMVMYPGANWEITPEYCDKVLDEYEAGDLILLQYETTQVGYLLRKAHEKGMLVAWNPSAFVPAILDEPLECVDILLVNEYEGQCISGECAPEPMTAALLRRMNGGAVVLTLGGEGAVYADAGGMVRVPAFCVDAVDTTGAGDTFTGYFLHSLICGKTPEEALRTACAASAIVVTKPGAAETIPDRETVERFLCAHC